MSHPQSSTITHALQDHALQDRWQRHVSYLRVSVTDRCNYACTYCAPLEGWTASTRSELLSIEELYEIISVMVNMGVERVRFTGGEPLLRRGLTELIRRVSALEGVREIALTTNAHLLERFALELYQAGLRRLNVSLDTFDDHLFKQITRGGNLQQVLQGLKKAKDVGFEEIQINAVLTPELPQNPSTWTSFVQRCWKEGWTPRWIELMPIGALKSQQTSLSNELVRTALTKTLQLQPNPQRSPLKRGPAQYYISKTSQHFNDKVGFIDPLSDDGFCAHCNRARLTARGGLRACLADDHEIDLKEPLRAGLHGPALRPFIEEALYGKKPQHLMAQGLPPLSIMTSLGG